MMRAPHLDRCPQSEALREVRCHPIPEARARGFVLVTCLLLLTVFAILCVAGFAAALAELRIASNVEQRERAFQAAEYGIEQALQSNDLATTLTYASPQLVPADGTRSTLPDPAAGSFAYRLYFASATPSGLPADDPAALLTAFHFVVEATGYGARGAVDKHVQGFKVLRPAGWTNGPAFEGCAPGEAGCTAAPRRTSWLQVAAE